MLGSSLNCSLGDSPEQHARVRLIINTLGSSPARVQPNPRPIRCPQDLLVDSNRHSPVNSHRFRLGAHHHHPLGSLVACPGRFNSNLLVAHLHRPAQELVAARSGTRGGLLGNWFAREHHTLGEVHHLLGIDSDHHRSKTSPSSNNPDLPVRGLTVAGSGHDSLGFGLLGDRLARGGARSGLGQPPSLHCLLGRNSMAEAAVVRPRGRRKKTRSGSSQRGKSVNRITIVIGPSLMSLSQAQ
ncbi:hypothetical protein Dimus_039611 [Dionaea muscipula]